MWWLKSEFYSNQGLNWNFSKSQGAIYKVLGFSRYFRIVFVKRKPWTWCIGHGPTQGLGPRWTEVPRAVAQDTRLAGDMRANSSWLGGSP
jgi:hypothetical protein